MQCTALISIFLCSICLRQCEVETATVIVTAAAVAAADVTTVAVCLRATLG